MCAWSIEKSMTERGIQNVDRREENLDSGSLE